MFTIYAFDEVSSTNDVLKQQYHIYQDHSVILAHKQTKGRGRFDRVWESQEDLTFSILLKNNYPNELIAPLSIVFALKQYGIQTSVKWPNDILIHGKKLCGILIESIYEGNEKVATVIGIGINLSKKDNLLTKADYVSLPKEELLQKILIQYDQLMMAKSSFLLSSISQYSYLSGRSILLDGIIWKVDGIEEHGYLRVHHQDTIRLLKSEEITLEAIYEKE